MVSVARPRDSAMAKKSTAKTPTTKPIPRGRPPLTGGQKKHILGLRGREEYKDWLGRFAERERSDVSDLVDDALVAYANLRGFETPPKR